MRTPFDSIAHGRIFSYQHYGPDSLIHRRVGAPVLDRVRRIALADPTRTQPTVWLHARLVLGLFGHLNLWGVSLRDLDGA